MCVCVCLSVCLCLCVCARVCVCVHAAFFFKSWAQFSAGRVVCEKCAETKFLHVVGLLRFSHCSRISRIFFIARVWKRNKRHTMTLQIERTRKQRSALASHINPQVLCTDWSNRTPPSPTQTLPVVSPGFHTDLSVQANTRAPCSLYPSLQRTRHSVPEMTSSRVHAAGSITASATSDNGAQFTAVKQECLNALGRV